MNKQELIKKLEERKTIIGNFQGYSVWWEDIKAIFEQLDEPKKVKIPQLVADIIEEYKDKGAPIIDIFAEKYSNEEYNTWLVNELNAYDRVAQAWLDGYEVEKEKRYQIKFVQTGQHLAKNIYSSGEYFVIKTSAISSVDSFTRKELEDAGFGWVFDCPGIEIEEVI